MHTYAQMHLYFFLNLVCFTVTGAWLRIERRQLIFIWRRIRTWAFKVPLYRRLNVRLQTGWAIRDQAKTVQSIFMKEHSVNISCLPLLIYLPTYHIKLRDILYYIVKQQFWGTVQILFKRILEIINLVLNSFEIPSVSITNYGTIYNSHDSGVRYTHFCTEFSIENCRW